MNPSRFDIGATPALRLALFAAACAASSAAFADCTSRPARPAETAFHARALSALVAALPPVPVGVQEVDGQTHDFKRPPAIREALCDFSKEGDFSVLARRQYVRKHSDAERKQLQARYDALTAQLYALRKTPPDLVARQEVLRKKSNEAWQAARDAEKVGDKQAAEARNAEYRAWRNEANAIDVQHRDSVKPETTALDKQRTDIDLVAQRVQVQTAMNLPRLPPAGSDESRGAYGVASPAKSAGLKVHNIVWAVEGTEGPLRQALAAAIDRARLQSLVGRPLPSEAESEALALQTAPVSVAAAAVGGANTPMSGADPTPATTAAATPAPPSGATTTAPAAGNEAAAIEPLKKAANAVDKLRGLLGR